MGEWDLGAATAGHFTSANDNNLILSGSNCDSHAQNFGGTFVFSMTAAKPRLLMYDKGLITNQCHKFRYADSRDFLVCRGGWSGQGNASSTVFMSSFNAAGKDASTVLFVATDLTGNCLDDPSTVVQSAGILDITFAPKDSGEITGMTISARLGNIKCGQVQSVIKSEKYPSSVKTYQIEFLFDGKQFKVAPAGRASLHAFDNNKN